MGLKMYTFSGVGTILRRSYKHHVQPHQHHRRCQALGGQQYHLRLAEQAIHRVCLRIFLCFGRWLLLYHCKLPPCQDRLCLRPEREKGCPVVHAPELFVAERCDVLAPVNVIVYTKLCRGLWRKCEMNICAGVDDTGTTQTRSSIMYSFGR